MKNFSRFLTLGATAALLAACSSDNAPDGPGAPESVTDGGFLAVNIQLPTEPSTRAINDDFADGETYEYGVNNAAIVLFQGANETDATFVGAYMLVKEKEDNDSPDNDNITVSHRMVAKISNSITKGGQLYALALVNYTNGIAEVGAADGSLTIGGVAFTGTFKDLLWKTSTDAFYSTASTSNFFMTNAPLCTAIGGVEATSADGLKNENVFTLAKFDFDKIKPTRKEAIADPASEIYVERAVAKVTMGWGSTATDKTFTLTSKDKDGKAMTAELVGWTVNNTEPSSYIVRNLGFNPVSGTAVADYLAYTSANLTETNYRFVGHSKMGSTTTLHPDKKDNLYRTYWCIDPHYTTTDGNLATTADVNNIADADWTADVDKAFYPHENTFCVEKQNFQNTTRVLLKVKINVEGAATDGTFYKMNDEIFAQMSDIESYAIDEIVNDPNFLAAVEEALKAEGKKFNEWKYADGDLVLTYETSPTTGQVKLDEVTCAGNLTGKIDTFDFGNIIDRINEAYVTYEYKGGISYYDLKIMHFASNSDPDADLAPWTAPATSATKTDEAYGSDPTASQNYLGRYGLVRNNWYDINVTGVAEVGSPVVPDANVDTSDDNNEVERYIAFKIHILSWAKRTNDYILK